MARFKVVGPHPVAGASPGETVELDAGIVNVPALIVAGHVTPAPAKPKPKDG